MDMLFFLLYFQQVFTSNKEIRKKKREKTTTGFKMHVTSECIAWHAVFVTESVIIVSVNLLTIIVFMRNKNLRKRSTCLVINLTVVDMLVGVLFGVPLFPFLPCNIFVDYMEVILTHVVLIFLLVASVTNIAVISLERMHATFRPFKHRVIKKWVYGVTIAGIWVLAFIVNVARMVVTLTAPVLLPVYYCMCLFVICVCYTCISIKFFCGAHPQHHGGANRQRKLTVTLLIMTIVSLIMFLPFVLGLFFFLTQKRSGLFRSPLYMSATFVLSGANSFVNPMLYTLRIPEFKKALISLFRRRRNENVVIPLQH